MYFKDLERVERSFGVIMVKVGWLDKGQPYTEGVAPKEFVEKLKRIPLGVHTKGWHDCPFCNDAKSSSQYQLRIGKSLVVYDAPQMILHYIAEHNYLPPQEFIDAVMNYPIKEVRKENYEKRYK